MYLVKVFLFFSAFGFFIEIFMKFMFHPSMNTGILYGPWIPIYGLGVVVTVVTGNFISKKMKNNIWKQALVMFFALFVIISLLEFSGGMLLEYTFGIIYWDHSHFALSIGPYIAAEMSIIWALLLSIFYYGIKNKADLVLKRIPNNVALFILILFCMDVIFTFLA